MPPKMQLYGLALDCADANALAAFYEELLGWPQSPAGTGWAACTCPESGLILAFQQVEQYRPPVWPWKEGEQGQMLHFDLLAEEYEAALQHALACGARPAQVQYYSTSKTFLDPAGHPFCIESGRQEAAV